VLVRVGLRGPVALKVKLDYVGLDIRERWGGRNELNGHDVAEGDQWAVATSRCLG
jgi:hypothetical protein